MISDIHQLRYKRGLSPLLPLSFFFFLFLFFFLFRPTNTSIQPLFPTICTSLVKMFRIPSSTTHNITILTWISAITHFLTSGASKYGTFAAGSTLPWDFDRFCPSNGVCDTLSRQKFNLHSIIVRLACREWYSFTSTNRIWNR